ncbi:uncharacterized protein K02A2.6-like [Hydractinia symbiolongicarpus]|uniref:uncharacterized protein K02A2.6-like n=1 Tax=Hydractinia symbiolongicarpus TaxID=13093 RepID=UPI00254D9184|nr:uncharacterized protein K02A2.6-like [Hydractinia symbiolongicarpus]
MAQSVDISCPKPFNVQGDSTSLGIRWKKWQNSFNIYVIAAGITDDVRKRALILHCAGDDVQEVFETLPNVGTTYADAAAALKIFFEPKQNKHFERHVFRCCKQNDGENIDAYVTRLRILAKTCVFHNTDEELVDQIIEKCHSNKLRKRILREPDLTLEKLLSLARISEVTSHQAKQYESSAQAATPLTLDSKYSDSDGEETQNNNYISRTTRTFNKPLKSGINRKNQQCYRCGSSTHLANKCEITQGKKCNKCGKIGHFSKVCLTQSKQVRYVKPDTSSSDNDDFVFHLSTLEKDTNPTITTININDAECEVMIDSGSSVNILDSRIIKQMHIIPDIHPYSKRVLAYNGQPIPITGYIWTTVKANTITKQVKWLIMENPRTNIMGYQTAMALQLLHFGPLTNHVNNILSAEEQLHTLLNKYSDRFKGLGQLKDVKIKIQVDNTVVPVAQKPRRLPIMLQKEVDQEIRIRLCIDMRVANSAIIREPYQIPTLEEVLHEFNGCTIFTTLDLNQGYHQITLDDESRDLTAFASSKGILRYTRLIYGISPAAEIYQREIEHVLQGLKRVRNISDDIIIGAESEKELLKRTEAALKRLRRHNITVNKDKCKFNQKELTYMGHTLSDKGLSPDNRKIEAVNTLKPPSNIKELRSFLGMINYCAKFLPNLADLTAPLRVLTKKNVSWEWTNEHQERFIKLKSMLTSAESLAYYNPGSETEITVDASPIGLGAVISQKQPCGTYRPISYASRSLSAAEQRYSQIEREALAILFAIERFKIYLYGITFIVNTDHKPLVALFGKKSNPPPRIERWVMKLLPYDFIVQFRPGVNNPADYLSRSNPVQTLREDSKMADRYIHMVCNTSLPVALSLTTIQEATHRDPVLVKLKECLRKGHFPDKGAVTTFKRQRLHLSVSKEIVMCDNKIVVPEELKHRVIDLAHEGHQGIVRTKQRLRTKVWWPAMNADVENFIRHCHPCQVVGPAQTPSPMEITPIPRGAWLMLGCDLCGPFPTGENLLVCIDYFSRFPEVEILHKITSTAIVTKLRKLFSRYGAPEELVSDNGPQFVSNTFKKLMNEFNIHHRRVTPYHPQANGEVERFNRNLKKVVQTAIAEAKDWRVVMQNFLLNYRNTPHATTGVTPAELLFNRTLRDKLPSPSECDGKTSRPDIRRLDTTKKTQAKILMDKSRRAKPHQIKVGTPALATNSWKHKNKYTSRWDPRPFVVTGVKGSAIFLKRDGKDTLRNSGQVKTYHTPRFTIQNRANQMTSSEDSDSDFELELPSIDNDIHNENIIDNSYDADTDSDATVAYDESDTEKYNDRGSNDKPDDEAKTDNEMKKRTRNKPRRLDDFVMD